MEARILAIERQLKNMFQVQKLLVTALDSKASILQSVGSDVSELLSEWNEQAVQLQSSACLVSEDNAIAEVAASLKDSKIIEKRIDSGVYPNLENTQSFRPCL